MRLQLGDHPLRIPGAGQLQQAAVGIGEVVHVLVDADGDARPLGRAHQLPHALKDLVPRRGHDDAVEQHVAPGQLRPVAAVGSGVHLVQGSLHGGEALVGDLRQPLAGGEALQDGAKRVNLMQPLLIHRQNETAAVRLDLHQAHDLQLPQRLPDGRLRNPELPGNLRLNQALAAFQLTGDDLVLNICANLIAEFFLMNGHFQGFPPTQIVQHLCLLYHFFRTASRGRSRPKCRSRVGSRGNLSKENWHDCANGA